MKQVNKSVKYKEILWWLMHNFKKHGDDWEYIYDKKCDVKNKLIKFLHPKLVISSRKAIQEDTYHAVV